MKIAPFRERVHFFKVIYLGLCWVFTVARGLSPVEVSRGLLSSCGLPASRCRAQALGCSLGSCGTQAYLLRSMWDLPGPHMVGTLVPCIVMQILSLGHQGRPKSVFLSPMLFPSATKLI